MVFKTKGRSSTKTTRYCRAKGPALRPTPRRPYQRHRALRKLAKNRTDRRNGRVSTHTGVQSLLTRGRKIREPRVSGATTLVKGRRASNEGYRSYRAHRASDNADPVFQRQRTTLVASDTTRPLSSTGETVRFTRSHNTTHEFLCFSSRHLQLREGHFHENQASVTGPRWFPEVWSTYPHPKHMKRRFSIGARDHRKHK